MDNKKPDPDPGHATMQQQSYPSPMVDGTEAQYYEQLAQHRELDPQMEHHQPAETEQQGLPSMPQDHGPHEHHGLHELQGLQEPQVSQPQNERPPVSADELQLAAQLTEGLAPMMAAAVQSQTQEQQAMPQQEGQDGQGHRQPEPDFQEQLEASLQNHDREMQGHEHELHDHPHHLQEHGLQDVMVHPDQPGQHHYVQNPPPHPPPPHLAHHLSMDHLPTAQPQYQLPDGTPPRKRSKVSRACDECRRKKIKCDAPSEATEQPCSNCRRSNAQCLFSRIPQKRGPSKGYIKELADRINTIEGKLNTNSVDSLERRASSEAFASPGLGDDSRKRPFASISSDVFQPSPPNKLPGAFAAGDYRPILPYVRPESRAADPLTSDGLGLRAAAPDQYPIDSGLQAQADTMDGVTQNGLSQGSPHEAEQLPEIEESAFNRYLDFIHPSFPVLASTKARMQSLVWQAPLTLQRAFYHAFFSVINPFTPLSDMHFTGDHAAACRLLSDWEGERKPRSAVTDLVRLQTLLLAAIAVDCHGIPSVKGELGGPSKAELIGRAVGLAYLMNLQTRKADRELPSPESDPDSDDNLAHRAWWVLVMLDRWNAASMAMPPVINSDVIHIRIGHRHLVGDVVLCLMRVSYILGFIILLAINPDADPFSTVGTTLYSTINLSVENIRFDFPDGCTDPVLYLAYWHMRLLAELLSSAQPADRILYVTKKMVEILLGHHELRSPLTSHFIALASLGLLHLLRSEGETRAETGRLIQNVLDFRLPASPWNDAVRAKLAQHYQPQGPAATTTAVAAPGGDGSATTDRTLQRLADLAATAADGSPAAAAAPPAAASAASAEPAPAPAPSQDVHSAAKEDRKQHGDVPNEAAALPQGLNDDTGKPAEGEAAAAAAQRSNGGILPYAPPPPPPPPLIPHVDVRALLATGYLTCFDEPVANGEDSAV